VPAGIVAMQAFLEEGAARDAIAQGGGCGVSTPVAGD
jgi:hypothetical protein